MVVKTMKESDFEQFCEMVPSLVSDISKMMGYRNKVYRNVTEVMDDKMMEKTVIILKELKMAIRNGSKLIKMDHVLVYTDPEKISFSLMAHKLWENSIQYFSKISVFWMTNFWKIHLFFFRRISIFPVISLTDFWKTHPHLVRGLDEFFRNRSGSCPEKLTIRV